MKESPCRKTAVPLPDDLRRIDRRVLGIFGLFKRDRGCYLAMFELLNVGVDGRKRSHLAEPPLQTAP
jgi:hypothetical protein